MPDPFNPWQTNYFDPAHPETPMPMSPTPSRKARPIPEQKEMFSVQKQLIKAISALKDFEYDNPKADTQKVRKSVEQAYKTLNHYLQNWAQ